MNLNFIIKRIYDAFHRRFYNAKNSRFENIEFSPGIISFSFDDFPISALDGAKSLEDRGWRGTFYVSPGLYNQQGPMGKICSENDLRSLYAKGHEIGSHTFSHFLCSQYGVRRHTLKAELQKCKKSLSNFDVINFAFPFGAYDTQALSFFGRYYSTLRTVEPGLNRGKVDLNKLKAIPIYETRSMDQLKHMIDDVANGGGWLIFYTHDVRENPSSFGCRLKTFNEILDYVASKNVTVLPVSSVTNKISKKKCINETP